MPGALADLNDRQRQAATHDGGPLIVLAGPGTGKTRVITHRIAHLISKGVSPGSILAVTFTVRAANHLHQGPRPRHLPRSPLPNPRAQQPERAPRGPRRRPPRRWHRRPHLPRLRAPA